MMMSRNFSVLSIGGAPIYLEVCCVLREKEPPTGLFINAKCLLLIVGDASSHRRPGITMRTQESENSKHSLLGNLNPPSDGLCWFSTSRVNQSALTGDRGSLFRVDRVDLE